VQVKAHKSYALFEDLAVFSETNISSSGIGKVFKMVTQDQILGTVLVMFAKESSILLENQKEFHGDNSLHFFIKLVATLLFLLREKLNMLLY
jgi:hypothetical protein